MTSGGLLPYGRWMFYVEWYLISSFLCAGLISLALADDTYGEEVYQALNCGPNRLYETLRILLTAPFILLI